MTKQMGLSDNAKDYLCRFYCIFDEMMQKMTSAELNDSISHNFIVQMVPHHQAAIDMSNNILRYTTNVTLQCIAQNIVKEQTEGIEKMNGMLACCTDCKNSCRDLCLYQHSIDAITQKMFAQMKASRTSNRLDCVFISEMIPHHRGAVEMSKTALQFCACKELRPILQNIYTSQRKGIMQMAHLASCLGC